VREDTTTRKKKSAFEGDKGDAPGGTPVSSCNKSKIKYAKQEKPLILRGLVVEFAGTIANYITAF
jgi:hypothetical protein